MKFQGRKASSGRGPQGGSQVGPQRGPPKKTSGGFKKKTSGGFKKGPKKGGFKKPEKLTPPRDNKEPKEHLSGDSKKPAPTKSFTGGFKKKMKPVGEVKFSTKDRSTFLNGFSTRKLERKSKGHLKTKKKLIQEKHREKQQFTSHIQKEYEKAHKSVLANMKQGSIEEGVNEAVQNQLPTIEDETKYFTKEKVSAIDDGFGDVVVQISSLESPEFARISQYKQPQQVSDLS